MRAAGISGTIVGLDTSGVVFDLRCVRGSIPYDSTQSSKTAD